MNRHQWIAAYFMEFVECTDCGYDTALAASEEAARMQEDLWGPDLLRWDDPKQAVQDEIDCWEP
jgi:hypothetical protein